MAAHQHRGHRAHRGGAWSLRRPLWRQCQQWCHQHHHREAPRRLQSGVGKHPDGQPRHLHRRRGTAQAGQQQAGPRRDGQPAAARASHQQALCDSGLRYLPCQRRELACGRHSAVEAGGGRTDIFRPADRHIGGRLLFACRVRAHQAALSQHRLDLSDF